MVAVQPGSTPSPWANPDLILYHGTVDTEAPSILSGIQITKGRANTDFGLGFYTTTVERQALAWAWVLSQRRSGTQPAVLRFDVDRDDLSQLECLFFFRSNFDADDFWSLVFRCRSTGADHNRHGTRMWYDVVGGPVAASWRQRLALYDTDQISFHTDSTANLLNRSNPRRIA